MKCPYCTELNTQVVDTRMNEDGDTVRRRRRCPNCDKRFTTYERVELQLPQIVKKNGSRCDYEREKLHASMMLAPDNTPWPRPIPNCGRRSKAKTVARKTISN